MNSIRKLSTVVFLIVCLLTGFIYFFYNKISSHKNVTLKIGLLPYKGTEQLINVNTPLLKHVTDEVGVSYQLIIPESYEEMLAMFSGKELDLALLGGHVFLKAHHDDGAKAMVISDLDMKNRTYFISRNIGQNMTIESFKGKKFCFGDQMSTSGHLMPRMYLGEKEIIPESYYASVEYSGSHDRSVEWVLDGRADLCAVHGNVVDSMMAYGAISSKDLSIIWESPTYHDNVWVAQAGMSTKLFSSIKKAFINMTHANEMHKSALNKLGIKRYVAVDIGNYKSLSEASIGF